MRVDRKRKQSAIVFLMAIGMTKSEIAQAFKDYPLVLDALEKDCLLYTSFGFGIGWIRCALGVVFCLVRHSC